MFWCGRQNVAARESYVQCRRPQIETVAAICARHEPRVSSGLRDFVLVHLVAFARIPVSLLAPAGWPDASDRVAAAPNRMPMPAW